MPRVCVDGPAGCRGMHRAVGCEGSVPAPGTGSKMADAEATMTATRAAARPAGWQGEAVR